MEPHHKTAAGRERWLDRIEDVIVRSGHGHKMERTEYGIIYSHNDAMLGIAPEGLYYWWGPRTELGGPYPCSKDHKQVMWKINLFVNTLRRRWGHYQRDVQKRQQYIGG